MKSPTYLNSANLSKCPAEIIAAMVRYQTAFESNPTQGLRDSWTRLWESQLILSEFLDADPRNLFLRTNVTSAFNVFLSGLTLKSGSEILVGEHEYGSFVNICRLKTTRDSLSFRVIKMPSNPAVFGKLSPQLLLESILEQISSKTSLILLSHVVGGTGLVLPIQGIAEHTRKRKIAFAVDGSYALGVHPVSFKELSDCDFYGSSLYKYLMGPKGTAFGWMSPVIQTHWETTEVGWTSSGENSPVQFGPSGSLASILSLKGCHDFANFFAISETIQMWKNMGTGLIRQHIHSLNDYLIEQFSKRLGWLPLKTPCTSLNGPFTAFMIPRNPCYAGDLSQLLLNRYLIQVNQMEINDTRYLVISPHIDNKKAEIDYLIDCLNEMNGEKSPSAPPSS